MVSQCLMRRGSGKGRVPAVKVLVTTAYIPDCITIPEKTALVRDAIATGTSQYGMQTFDQSLYSLWQKKLVTYEEALAGATNPGEFKLRVEGIHSSGDIADEETKGGNGAGPQLERFGSR